MKAACSLSPGYNGSACICKWFWFSRFHCLTLRKISFQMNRDLFRTLTSALITSPEANLLTLVSSFCTIYKSGKHPLHRTTVPASSHPQCSCPLFPLSSSVTCSQTPHACFSTNPQDTYTVLILNSYLLIYLFSQKYVLKAW